MVLCCTDWLLRTKYQAFWGNLCFFKKKSISVIKTRHETEVIIKLILHHRESRRSNKVFRAVGGEAAARHVADHHGFVDTHFLHHDGLRKNKQKSFKEQSLWAYSEYPRFLDLSAPYWTLSRVSLSTPKVLHLSAAVSNLSPGIYRWAQEKEAGGPWKSLLSTGTNRNAIPPLSLSVTYFLRTALKVSKGLRRFDFLTSHAYTSSSCWNFMIQTDRQTTKASQKPI